MESIGIREKIRQKQNMTLKVTVLFSMFPITTLIYFYFTDTKADFLGISLVVCAFISLILWIVFFGKPSYIFYLPCPYCDNSVKMVEKWTCDKCNHIQAKAVSVIYPCEECGRSLETAFCEHCGEEFRL